MSGGVTSYPRTGGGGGSTVQQINQLIARLTAALGTQSLQVQGDQLIVLLQQFALSAATAQSIVTLARRVRDALFIARCNGNLPVARHLEAMVICADAWRTVFPLAATALGPRAAKAELDLAQHKANGGNTQQLRAIKEEMGVIAWQYEASALLGEDLSAGVAGQATQLGTSKYIGARDAKNRLTYLECAGPYNVNVLLCIHVPSAGKPLVLVGEAKGARVRTVTSKGRRLSSTQPGLLEGASAKRTCFTRPLGRCTWSTPARQVPRRPVSRNLRRVGTRGTSFCKHTMH